MQNPFFRRQYTTPSSRPYNATAKRSDAGVPVQRPPKVISIPVHFIDSEISKSTAAKRIQKVFRGFVVRRNVNKIAGIKKQVNEMEANLSLEETVDLVRKDAKERLKVNESLMSLLLRLDSVRSFDSSVRDLRKSVIKKVIVLQERLDATVSIELNKEMDEVSKDAGDEIVLVEDDAVDDPIEEIKYPIEPTHIQIGRGDETPNCGEKEESCDVAEQDETLKETEIEKEIMKDATEETVSDNGGMEMQQQQQQPDLIQGKCDGDDRKEVIERMMEKNDILIGMVRELCEKNKMQTEIISSLSKRVDSLEKAFKRSKSKKRKQTTAAAGFDVNHGKKF